MNDIFQQQLFCGILNKKGEGEQKSVLPDLNYHFYHDHLSVKSSIPFYQDDNYCVVTFGSIFSDSFNNSFSQKDSNNAHIYNHRLLNAFKKYSTDLQSHLEGFYLGFVFCFSTQEWHLINNRYQATSLYYYIDKTLFVFAKTMRDLLAILPFKPRFESRALPSFLSTGFSFTEKTQFKNIYRLLPKHSIAGNNTTISIKNNWPGEFSFNRQSFDDLELHLDKYERLFSKSISQFLDTTQPENLGCFLSGGHDTSFVFIKASQLHKKPIHTFTVFFENFGFSESPKAAYLTKKFNGIHHPVSISHRHLDYVPLMVRINEEPVPGGGFPIFVCIMEAKKHVNALLSGDAGDTLWGEYYPVAQWHRYISKLPYFIRKSFYKLNEFMLSISDWERLWESEHVFSLFAQKDMYNNFFQRLCTYRHYSDDFLRSLLNPDYFPAIQFNKSSCNIEVNRHNLFNALVETKMFYGLYQYMIPPTQKPLSFFNIQHYPPYLNHDIISFINDLPESWLNGGSAFKKLTNTAHSRKFLKMALLRYLPKKYVYAAQQSLDVPFPSLLNKRPYVLENLRRRLKRRGWYNNTAIDRLFDEFKQQSMKSNKICELKHHGYRIFCLLTFETWCMEFLDKKPSMTLDKTIIPLEDYLS